MYIPRPGVKQDVVRQWRLHDRAFFAHGACHILAFVFLERFQSRKFYPVLIKPGEGYRGSHVFVTNGLTAFDFRGYLRTDRLLAHHGQQYRGKYPGWNAELIQVKVNLCRPSELASLGVRMRGPDEFLHDALSRAQAYLAKYDRMHDKYTAG